MPSPAAPDFGSRLPELLTRPPGPRSREMADRLRAVESRNITWRGDGWPVFWEEASGANVRDVDGNVYIDLTSAFGVALLGHHPDAFRRAVDGAPLIHGMGDIHPPREKLELLEALDALMPWPVSRTVLASTGSESVEIALKTGALSSGRPGVLAFEGGYHGLTLGSLAATNRPHFRSSFERRLYDGVVFEPFPDRYRTTSGGVERALEAVRNHFENGAGNGDAIGTVIVEPVQARGGARPPADGFMEGLSDLAREFGVVVVADEIFTGLGRCGGVLASSRVGLVPDIVCVGKSLGAGLPLSACTGAASVMDSWPESSGEAIHTSTFLGHPLACRAGVEALKELRENDLAARADTLGRTLVDELAGRLSDVDAVGDVRGLGLLIGIEFIERDGSPRAGFGARIAEAALTEGLLLLPAGEWGEVLELSPPVSLTTDQSRFAVETIEKVVRELA